MGTSRGTGFAIAPDRVLTSLHVVGKVVDGELRLHGESIRIAAAIASGADDGEPREAVCVATRADIVDHDPELDWVAIRVDAEAFAGLAVPALGAVAASDQSASWSTYGFPDGNDRLGKATGGVVESTAALVRLGSSNRTAIQLFSREAGAASGGAVRGYSGAPVIVDGHVLGLLCAASEDAEGRSAEGTLYAIPVAPIAKRLGLALRPRDRSSGSPPMSTPPAPSLDPPSTDAPVTDAPSGDVSRAVASRAPRQPLYSGTFLAAVSAGSLASGALGGALMGFDWMKTGALLDLVGQLSCAIILLTARESFDAVRELRLHLARFLPALGLIAVGFGATGLSIVVVEWLRQAGSLATALRSHALVPADVGALVAGLLAMMASPWILIRPAHAPGEAAAAPRAAALEPAAPPLPEVFHERVRMLFEKRAFARFELATYDAAHGCLVGHSDDAAGRHRVVVRCDDRGAPIEDADVAAVIAYAASLRAGDGAQIYYVTPSRAVNAAEFEGRVRGVELTSEAELLDCLVHFDGYLSRVITIYEKDPLPYSNTAEVKSLADTFVAPRFGLHGSADSPRGSLRDYLDAWLADRHPRQIALLADYGMGKSSFLRHYAWHLARKRLDGEPGRIPILLSLTGRSPRNPPGADGLLHAFIDQYQLRCEVAAFRLLMRAGRLVFLIDAFDEMDLVGDRAMRLDHFAALWRLYAPGNKLLFAGRPTFFPDEAELNEAFRIADRGPDRLTGGVYCERLSLAPLADDDIEQSFTCYFEPTTARRHYEWVHSNPRLLDLARRPAMMHIIRDTIDELRAQHAEPMTLREASLLQLYTRHWIEREEGSKQRKLLISRELRARFSEQLAAWMFETERRTVESHELGELFTRWFPDEAARVASGAGAARAGANAGRSHLLEGIETDLRNCTFLVRDPNEAYSFAHKPFFEYFVAASLDRCLRDRRPVAMAFQFRFWGIEIALHVGDLWLLRRRGAIEDAEAARVFRAIVRAGMRAALRNSLRDFLNALRGRRLLESGARSPVQPSRRGWRRVLDALATVSLIGPAYRVVEEAFATSVPPRLNALQVLLRAGIQFEWVRQRFFHRIRARLGDTTHSDRCLPVLELAGARLDGAKLRDLDFSGRSLRGASFVRARISGCRFDRADLTEANLERAQLQNVSLVGAMLRRARFDNAHIAGCRFDHADAEEAVLDAANIRPNVSMRFLSLRRASLQGAVIEADLTGVDAIGASLANAFIDTSRAARAKLPSDPPPTVELAPITLGTPHTIAWSPDDACLLVVSRGSAWLIDAGDGALIRRFQDPVAPILAAAFRSPTEVVAATAAGTLAIHDLQNDTKREGQLGFPLAGIALSANGVMFVGVATIPAGSSGGRLKVVFGRSDDLAHAITLDSAAVVLDEFHISSIAVDDGATTAAVLARSTVSGILRALSALAGPRARSPRSTIDHYTLIDLGATSASGILVVHREGASGSDSLAASNRLFDKPASAGARVLLRADGKVVAIAEDGAVRRCALGEVERGSDRLHVSRAATLSPDGGWFDTRDPEWADAVPTQLAERMGLTEHGRSPAVHAHRDHEVAAAGPGMLAIVDSSSRLCRPFVLGADAMHAATDPPRVIDDLRFLEDGHLVTAGLSTVRRWDVRALCEAASVQHGEWLQTAIVLAVDGHAVRGVLFAGGEPRPEARAGRALCAGAHRVVLAIEDPGTKQVGAVAVCDLATGARLVELPAADVALAALGEGDRWLAFASGHQVTVVDLDTERSHSRALENAPTALAFFEGRSCVIGDAGGRLQSFGKLGAFAPHEDTVQISSSPITALAAAGSRFAIATGDGKLHTWSPGDAAPAQLAGLPAATSRLAFSLDGALLAAATDDDIVRVFAMPSGKLVARLYHLEAGWAAVRADGKYDHDGDVSRLSCVSGLRTYRLRDLDELLPGGRLPRPRV